MRIRANIPAISAMTLLASACASTPASVESTYDTTITRTTHAIPHITSDTWRGVGYGVAYAYAQDNLCMLAEEFTTVAGERSKYFGPEGKTLLGLGRSDNLTSDLFFRSQIDLPTLREGMTEQSDAALGLLNGYVAGYNRYLRDTGIDNLPEACRDKDWVRPISTDDMLRLNEKQMLLASSLALAAGIATAAPPEQQTAQLDLKFPEKEEPKYGSNGWAFGGDVTADGRGMVIGNPHFPWEGPARFWQMHVQGPEGYDVMGVGIAGTPIPTLGFNRNVAWTHTVTAARHFTVYALALSPESSTTYMLDGKPVQMEAREISVPMPAGREPVVRTLYNTEFGPVVTVPGSGVQWTKQLAFALRDANSGNQRAIDAWLKIGQASDVGEIEAAVSDTLGIPWVNTIAADRNGDALHADVTAVPNVTADLIANCSTPFSGLVASRVTLLDGSRAECDWNTASDNPKSGLLPASEQAARTRRDYVTNSNDSYWISNPRNPWKELSPILGEHSKALSLRTRSNFIETEAALAAGKMNHAAARRLVFGNESLAADMVLDGLVKDCFGMAAIPHACTVLAKWDRRFEADSKGAYLFVTFWNKVRRRDDLWSVPFDPANPIETPRNLVTDNLLPMALREKLLEAAAEIQDEGIALDAPWGEVQVRIDGDDRIAVHGGPGTAGVLNMQRSRKIAGGITPVHGSSYIQIVGFDKDGPVADAILSYSQSTNPTSRHYADQTRNYAAKKWHRLPFSDKEIEAERIGETLKLSE